MSSANLDAPLLSSPFCLNTPGAELGQRVTPEQDQQKCVHIDFDRQCCLRNRTSALDPVHIARECRAAQNPKHVCLIPLDIDTRRITVSYCRYISLKAKLFYAEDSLRQMP